MNYQKKKKKKKIDVFNNMLKAQPKYAKKLQITIFKKNIETRPPT